MLEEELENLEVYVDFLKDVFSLNRNLVINEGNLYLMQSRVANAILNGFEKAYKAADEKRK